MEDRNVEIVPWAGDKLNESSRKWVKRSEMEGGKKKRKLLDVFNDLKRDKLHLAQQFFFKMNHLLTVFGIQCFISMLMDGKTCFPYDKHAFLLF